MRCILLDGSGLWDDAASAGALSTTATTTADGSPTGEGPLPFEPLPRLWRPDPLVRDSVLPALLRTIDAGGDDAAAAEVWDLGSGAGRDLCYLAEEARAHWSRRRLRRWRGGGGRPRDGTDRGEPTAPFPLRFVGVDVHKSSRRKCLPLFERRGVADYARSRLLDLSKVDVDVRAEVERVCRRSAAGATCGGADHEGDGNEKKDDDKHGSAHGAWCGPLICAYAVRYINRDLFRYLASPFCPLPIGFVFATSNFCKPYDGAGWDFDHPKERNVLDRTELRDIFKGSALWEVTRDDISKDDDLGRTLVRFVAMRVA